MQFHINLYVTQSLTYCSILRITWVWNASVVKDIKFKLLLSLSFIFWYICTVKHFYQLYNYKFRLIHTNMNSNLRLLNNSSYEFVLRVMRKSVYSIYRYSASLRRQVQSLPVILRDPHGQGLLILGDQIISRPSLPSELLHRGDARFKSSSFSFFSNSARHLFFFFTIFFFFLLYYKYLEGESFPGVNSKYDSL